MTAPSWLADPRPALIIDGELRVAGTGHAPLRRAAGALHASWPDGVSVTLTIRNSARGQVLTPSVTTRHPICIDALGVAFACTAPLALTDGYQASSWAGARALEAPFLPSPRPPPRPRTAGSRGTPCAAT